MMSDTHANMTNLQHLPIVVIREIIKQGQESAQGMRMISSRWNAHVVEYLNGNRNRAVFPSLLQFSWRIDVQQRSHLSIQLEDKYRAYFGIENWPFRPIVNDSTEDNIVEVNFSVVTYRILPKWAWSAVNQLAQGYCGSMESILLDLISSQSDDPNSSYMCSENLLVRIAHLLNRCSHIEKLVLNFDMKYDVAEFEIIKCAMKTLRVDHLELVGLIDFKLSAKSKILSLIKQHPVKSLTIGMWTPDPTLFNTFFAEAVLLTQVRIRVHTWFGEWLWKGLERKVNMAPNPSVQVEMEYPKSGVVLINVLSIERL